MPGLDRFFDPFEQSREAFAERTGLNLSFDYQAFYQKSSDSLSGIDEAASGQARIIGNWELLNRGSENAGSFVFILENRHRLGTDIAPGGRAGLDRWSG